MLLTPPFPVIPTAALKTTASTFTDTPTAFVPGNGLMANYRASALSSSPVSSWPDSSGRGKHLNLGGTTPPTLDTGGAFPVVRWDGTQDLLQTSTAIFSGGQARTLAVVFQMDDSGTYRDICGQGDNAQGGGWGFYVHNNAGTVQLTTGGSPVGAAKTFATAYRYTLFFYSGSAMSTTDATGNGGPSVQAIADAAAPFSVGQNTGTYAAARFKGSVAEVVIYDHVLTAAEQTALLNYFAARYSV